MTEIIARELSAAGYNTYSMECVRDGETKRGTYAVCQHVIRAVAQNRLQGFSDCLENIKAKACPAMKMMVEEKRAGRALYFTPYQPPEERVEVAPRREIDRTSEAYKRGFGLLTMGREPEAKTRTKTESAPVVFDPSKIVAKALERETLTP